MKATVNEMNQKLHVKLDEGLARLKTVKKQMQDFQIDVDVVKSEKLKAARDLFADKKLEAYAAKAQLEKLLEEKKEETEITVAEWKSKHDKKKLENELIGQSSMPTTVLPLLFTTQKRLKWLSSRPLQPEMMSLKC